MKLPKNKANLFLVERLKPNRVVIACFSNLERAEDYAKQCEQQMIDSGWEEFDLFTVTITPYYG